MIETAEKQANQYDIKDGIEDNMGFVNFDDGSFYDPDGVFFNKEGLDEFGGHYDDKNVYVPGELNKHLYDQEYDDDDDAGSDGKFDEDPLVK